MRKISITILTIILMLGVSGCMTSNITKNPTIDLVSYMNNKYDDEFSYKAPFGGGAGATTKQIIVSSKKYPEYDIWVEYSSEDNTYYDNYTDYRFKTDFEEYVAKNLSDCLKCQALVKRTVSTSGCYATYDSDTTFDEYMNTSRQINSFSAVVQGCDGVADEDIEKKISEILSDYSSGFFGNIYFIDDGESLDSFFELNIDEQEAHRSVFVKRTNKGATNYEWR